MVEASKKKRTKADYAIGYGKPPREHQFQPGRSGNPKGKPKGSVKFKTDLMEELNERVTITQNGKTSKVSKQRLVIKALTSSAMKGDLKAAATLISLIGQTLGLDQEDGTAARLSANDQVLLDALLHGGQAEPQHSENQQAQEGGDGDEA